MLRQVTKPKCMPVSLAQARKHLSVDSSDRSNDILIEMLIESATADSQMKTGRVWVESDWDWIPEIIEVNSEIKFPIVPVVKVKLYDLDEEFPEPEEPENPDPAFPDYPDEFQKNKRKSKKDTDEKEYTDIAEEYLEIDYPSPDPLGLPVTGSVVPKKAFPLNFRLVLTVGYPVNETEEVIEQYDNPVLVKDKTSYGDNKIRLVFNRPVQGDISVQNFELRINGLRVFLEDAYFKDACVELQFDPMQVESYGNGDKASISFFEGAIYDQFNNFVQPIVEALLPMVQIVPDNFFNTPDPLPTQTVYESLSPSPVKNWILTRVGTLYTQRTEIALRAGKSNDALFKDEFINNLLDPYRVRFFC